ncbi:hypothetical protein FO519_002518 [Halicephalobus sp. NKZ332]|nr:hypothetical protein FO519_002518 [Halicephalobus sp. NKZ332]
MSSKMVFDAKKIVFISLAVVLVLFVFSASASPHRSTASTMEDFVQLEEGEFPSYQFYGNSGNKRQLKAFSEKSGPNNNAMNMMRALIALRRYKR